MKRSRFFVSATVLILGCAGAGLLLHGRSRAQPLPQTVSRDAVKQAARHRARHPVYFGIADPGFVHLSAKRQARTLAWMRSIGINSIRVDANWDWVQYAGQHTFDWTLLDREVHSARAAGMTVELIVDGCPPWAALPTAASDPSPQPASALQFAAWAADVAARYRPEGVRYFEIWNEPNDHKFWQPRANPAFYARMLKDSYRAIKKINPSAFIIAGGLAPVMTHHGSMSMIAFLKALYAHGAKKYFNAVATHPYSFPALPGTYEPWSAWSQMSQTAPSMRGVMKSHGDGGKQIWLTEFGAPSNGPGGVGPKGEAAELKQAIALAKSTRWIRAIYFYTWQDAGANPNTNADWFGLLTNHGRRKTAYYTVARMLGKRKR